MSTSKWDQRRAEREARLNLLGDVEERAAIMEYDGELLRETAERLTIFDFITCHKNAFKNYEEILPLLENQEQNYIEKGDKILRAFLSRPV